MPPASDATVTCGFLEVRTADPLGVSVGISFDGFSISQPCKPALCGTVGLSP